MYVCMYDKHDCVVKIKKPLTMLTVSVCMWIIGEAWSHGEKVRYKD